MKQTFFSRVIMLKGYHRVTFVVVLLAIVMGVGILSSMAPVAHAANSPKAVAAPLACPPTIGYGNTGQWVKVLQENLNSQYEYDGVMRNYPYNFHPLLKVDSIFGTDTENATKDFQYAFGLSVDGIAGPHTWSMLGFC